MWLEKSLMRMFGLKYGWNDEMTLRLVDEEDFGGKYVEAQAHDTGKFHEILNLLDLLNSAFEFSVGLLADTMHKSESCLLLCWAE